ncbi:putative Solute carrier family 35 member F5 [Paratrimastix pyriformis]|uniref:Solute carrier family 35 member F5 n=1 Tax=Paratrimastix pyriformis TaxID=342808 RepID=A0ABQ8UX99_9EUKA|nr:putative Solute carrier family 35 member F5 [Paratrimastix pyriformis]
MTAAGSKKRYFLGVVLLLTVVFIWVASSNLIQAIFHDSDYDHPFFLTNLDTSLFTLYLFGFFFSKQWRSRLQSSTRLQWRDSFQWLWCGCCHRQSTRNNDAMRVAMSPLPSDSPILRPPSQEQLMPFPKMAALSIIFAMLWFLQNWTFNISLDLTSVSSNSIISASGGLWAFLLSLLMLRERFSWFKLAGVLLCLGGVVVITLTDTGGGGGGPAPTLWGDVLALVSAITFGLYSVLLRKLLGDEKNVPMMLLFGLIGMWNMVLLWPMFLLLHYTGLEPFALPGWATLGYLLLNGVCSSLLSDWLWSLSVFYTSATASSVGLSLSIPLAMLGDFLFHGKQFTWLYLLGTALVIAGFVLVNVLVLPQPKPQPKPGAAPRADGTSGPRTDVSINAGDEAAAGEGEQRAPGEGDRDSTALLAPSLAAGT